MKSYVTDKINPPPQKKKLYTYTYNNFFSGTTDPVIISYSIHTAVNNNKPCDPPISQWCEHLTSVRQQSTGSVSVFQHTCQYKWYSTCSNHCDYGFQFTAIRSSGNFFSISFFFRISLHSLPFVVLSSSFLYSSLLLFILPYLLSFLFTSVSTIIHITYSSCNQ